jgi:hypothetical protein
MQQTHLTSTLKKNTQLILVKSSINSRKYLLPFKDVVGIGPHTSVGISYKDSQAL